MQFYQETYKSILISPRNDENIIKVRNQILWIYQNVIFFGYPNPNFQTTQLIQHIL